MEKKCGQSYCDAKNLFRKNKPLIVKTGGKDLGRVINDWRSQVIPATDVQMLSSDDDHVGKGAKRIEKENVPSKNFKHNNVNVHDNVISGVEEQDSKSCHSVTDDEKSPDLETDSDDDDEVRRRHEKKKKKKQKKERNEERKERKKRKEKRAEVQQPEQQVPNQYKTLLKESCGCPKKSMAEFKAEMQKKQDMVALSSKKGNRPTGQAP